MPIDWSESSVRELQERGILLVEDGNHGEYRPRRHEFAEGSTRYIRASNMTDARVRFRDADLISDAAVERIRKGVGRGGDIIFSHKGTVGKLALTPRDAPPFVCSPQTTFWRALNDDVLDPRFLYYLMQSRYFERQWRVRKGETDMADYVSLTAQRNFKVLVPDISTQRAIADILGSLDDKIELNRRMSRTLEATARAIFRSWFVDFEPVVAKEEGREPFGMDAETAALFPDRLVESELGPIPEGWEVRTTKDLAAYVNGRNFTKNATGSGRMVIRISELKNGPGRSTVYNEVDTTAKHLARPGDILFAWSGSLDVYRWFRGEAIVNQHIFKVMPHDLPHWFVFHHLQEAMPGFQRIAAAKATTMGHIRRAHLEEPLCAVPDVDLMPQADGVLRPLWDLWLHNHRESQTLAALRDLLLPKLLSGEIRVPEAAELAESVA